MTTIRQQVCREDAADSLRRYEQSGKRLKDWDNISSAQKKKWLAKVLVVMGALGILTPEEAQAEKDKAA
jgi:hypothetical protein